MAQCFAAPPNDDWIPTATPFETPSNTVYKKGPLIGEGGDGNVYRGVDVKKGTPVAIKEFKKTEDYNREKAFQDEVKACREAGTTSIRFIANMIEAFSSGGTAPKFSMIITYLGDTNLEQVNTLSDGIDLPVVISITRDLIETLKAVHLMGFTHYDVLAKNIMVYDGHAYLIDFGSSKKQKEDFSPKGDLTDLYAILEQYLFNRHEQPEKDFLLKLKTSIDEFDQNDLTTSYKRVETLLG